MTELSRTARLWRGLCLALLLANLMFLIGARWLQAPAPVHQPLPAGVARLALATEVPPKPPRRCITIGPFSEPSELAAAGNLLREVGYVPRTREVPAEVREGYLVLINGIRSTRQLDSAMNRLRRAGIADAALLPDGSPGIRVSVGLFREQRRAEERAAAVRKLGLQVELMERLGPGKAAWLDIDLRAAGEELDPQSFKSDGSLQVQPCPPAVASTG